MTYKAILTDPTEFNEVESEQKNCNLCSNELTTEEIESNMNDDGFCNDCFYSCCGDKLDQDIRICPTCKEHN